MFYMKLFEKIFSIYKSKNIIFETFLKGDKIKKATSRNR